MAINLVTDQYSTHIIKSVDINPISGEREVQIEILWVDECSVKLYFDKDDVKEISKLSRSIKKDA